MHAEQFVPENVAQIPGHGDDGVGVGEDPGGVGVDPGGDGGGDARGDDGGDDGGDAGGDAGGGVGVDVAGQFGLLTPDGEEKYQFAQRPGGGPFTILLLRP